MRARLPQILLAAALLVSPALCLAQCPASVPAAGAALPVPLPLFPADNWWNTDISAAPVDANSTSFIAFAAFSRPLSSPPIANTGIVSRRSLRPSFCAALVGIAR